MHAHWKVSLAACTLLLFYGVLASAADMNDCQNPSVMEGPAGIIRTSTLVGTTVLDPQNQALGRIKDVLLDAQTGRASFVVLDAEATHASHAMLVVPYDALRVGSYPAQHRLWVVLDLRPDQVRVAPQISNNQWQMLEKPAVPGASPRFLSDQDVYRGSPDQQPDGPDPECPAAVVPGCGSAAARRPLCSMAAVAERLWHRVRGVFGLWGRGVTQR